MNHPLWTVHRETPVFESSALKVHVADVETPTGNRDPYHLVRMPAERVGALVVAGERSILLIYRYRFVIDRWGWEIPAGNISPAETPDAAAARAVLAETGWEPQAFQSISTIYAVPGLSDQRFRLLLATDAVYRCKPTAPYGSAAVTWTPGSRIPGILQAGEVSDMFTMNALLWFLLQQENLQEFGESLNPKTSRD